MCGLHLAADAEEESPGASVRIADMEGVQRSSPLNDVNEYVTNGAIRSSSDVPNRAMDLAILPGPDQRDSGSEREGAGVNIQHLHCEECQSQT